MSTAQVQNQPSVLSRVSSRARSPLVDYLAFTLLFASVSVAVAIALGGIVLLLVPSGDSPARIEANPSASAQLSTTVTVGQVNSQ